MTAHGDIEEFLAAAVRWAHHHPSQEREQLRPPGKSRRVGFELEVFHPGLHAAILSDNCTQMPR
jgi:hypothetical protein